MNFLLILYLFSFCFAIHPSINQQIQKRSIVSSVQSYFAERKRKKLEKIRQKRIQRLNEKLQSINFEANQVEFLYRGETIQDLIQSHRRHHYWSGVDQIRYGRLFSYKTRLEKLFQEFLTDYFDFHHLDKETTPIQLYEGRVSSELIINNQFVFSFYDKGRLAYLINNYRDINRWHVESSLAIYYHITSREVMNTLGQWHIVPPSQSNPSAAQPLSTATPVQPIVVAQPVVTLSPVSRGGLHEIQKINEKLDQTLIEEKNHVEECFICGKEDAKATHRTLCCNQCVDRHCVYEWWEKLPARVPLHCAYCRKGQSQ